MNTALYAVYAVEIASVVALARIVPEAAPSTLVKLLVALPAAMLIAAMHAPRDLAAVQVPERLAGRAFEAPYTYLRTGNQVVDAALLGLIPATIAYLALTQVGGWTGVALALPPLVIAYSLIDTMKLETNGPAPMPAGIPQLPEASDFDNNEGFNLEG